MITWENLPNDGFNTIAPWTEVSETIYRDMLDVLPPIYLEKSPLCGFQVGEPASHEEDAQGRFRAKYSTFVRLDGRYYYAGDHFGGECSPPPPTLQ